MVNTATQIDGQTIAIEGQETQEADEPPIGALKRPNLEEKQSQDKDLDHINSKKDGLINELPTAGSSFIDIRSSDGTLINGSWDGNAEYAHAVDATDIASYLEVNPRYFVLF